MTTYTDEELVDDLANQLFTSLISDAPVPPTVDFTDPDFEFVKDETSGLYENVTPISLEELTTVDLQGTGVFDKLMQTMDLHINREFKNNRITGDQYAKVYTEFSLNVLNTATQFVLQKDQAKWAAITAQMQARIASIQAVQARIDLERAKAETQKMIFDMKNSGATYALTKMQLANENAKHFSLLEQTRGETFKNDFLLPAELAIQQYQRIQVLPSTVAINKVQSDRILPADAAIKEYTNRVLQPLEKATQEYTLNVTMPIKTDIDQFQRDSLLPVTLAQEQHKLNQQLPAQTNLIKEQHESQRAQTMNTRSDGLTVIAGLLGKQKESITLDVETKQFNIDETMPVQLDLVKEQREAERSKTLNTRSDGVTVVVGSVGKQKDLYTQQIDSFIKDAKYKTTKMYLDGWITQKTLDEGLLAPTELQNTAINAVLAANRTDNDL